MRIETVVLHQERNVTLTAYLQETAGEFGFERRPAMLVLPGGGYAMCSDREADPIAFSYAKAGYQTFVLRYTCTPVGKWPLPLVEYEEAMQLLQDRAEEWKLDPKRIAVVGFSAGGHLAACAATVAEHKPAAAILVYPAILRDIVDMCQPGMPYPAEQVNASTAPCFIVAARDDRIVDISNSLAMEQALAKNGISFESHIYAYGGHGFSTAEGWLNSVSLPARAARWVEDSIAWLGEVMGELSPKGFTEPNSAVCMNGNAAPVLSIACTLGHFDKQSDAAREILRSLYDAMKAVAAQRGFSAEGLHQAMSGTSVRELLEMLQFSPETVHEMDTQLHHIVNTL